MAAKPCKRCKLLLDTGTEVCPNCGKKRPTGGLTIPIKITLAVVGVLSIPHFMRLHREGRISGNPSPEFLALQKTQVQMQWEKSGFGNVMLANLTVVNDSDFAVKDLTIRCTHYAASGTQIDSNTRTIFDIVPPRSRKVFPRFNMGFIHNQVETSAVKLVDLQIAQ